MEIIDGRGNIVDKNVAASIAAMILLCTFVVQNEN